MMAERRRIGPMMAAALLAAATCLSSAARAEMEHTIVSLPAENFGFLPFYIAQDAHFFDQQELEVTKVVLPGVGTTNGVISGSVNFGLRRWLRKSARTFIARPFVWRCLAKPTAPHNPARYRAAMSPWLQAAMVCARKSAKRPASIAARMPAVSA